MPFRWLRRAIRRNTRPIPVPVAHDMKKKLSLAYAFLAWNAFAIVAYAIYSGKRDWAAYHGLEVEQGTPAQQFSRMLDIPKAKVITISGFTKVKEYEIDNTRLLENVRE